MNNELRETLYDVTRRLLDAIDSRDFQTYAAMSDEKLFSFEPEGRGQPLHGLPFHEFFFSKQEESGVSVRSEIVGFHARAIGESPAGAVVGYTRITQAHRPSAGFDIVHANETRVYERSGDEWKQVHFHRAVY